MPRAWEQLDSWMRPKLLDAVPSVIREWVSMRARQGRTDESHIIVFWVVKQFGPGNAEEQVALNGNILNPHVCTNPRAAQLELLKWKENVRRVAELNIAPPPMLLCYRGMESIFSAVFDKAEPMLHARWIALKNQLGLPYRVDGSAIEAVHAFADAELGALILQGNSQLNPGLPLTENQRNRQSQIKDADKKRASLAKAKAGPQQPTKPAQPDTTAAGRVPGTSATTSMWAKPCKSWESTGTCSRGISCFYAHKGFPVSENRCITCGRTRHSNKECKAPGGGAD